MTSKVMVCEKCRRQMSKIDRLGNDYHEVYWCNHDGVIGIIYESEDSKEIIYQYPETSQ